MTNQDNFRHCRIGNAGFDIIVRNTSVSCVVRQASLYHTFKKVCHKPEA